jgi:hypothetical protein
MNDFMRFPRNVFWISVVPGDSLVREGWFALNL